MSELTRRVLFSVVAIPIALAAIWFGDWALAALLAIAAALAAAEYFRIAREAGHQPFVMAGAALAGLVPIVMHGRRLGVFGSDLVTLAVVLSLAIFAAAIWKRWPDGRPIGAAATTVFGIVYTGGTLAYGYSLRYHPYAVGAVAGSAMVALPLILTWTSDIGAYFVGRALGRRKLIPAVSPGKTVAGAVGALVLCMLVAWAYQRWVLVPRATLALRPLVPALGASGALLFGALISVVAQVGDLAESLIKRESGVKDSSHLIPGHGGVLDRLDSLFFVLPTAYLLFDWLLIPALR
ncbi:MAG: phosphatidate cytidylyltransferase [Gemmatimonadaceae bacterium]|nr:phosphatidate cytidylyltransferase [Gemmatimonadaceae bacterium]NUR20682.1 phosphatidate cytidylyltransferase [Gemmatimonadaceae bacterium]NUS97316.1 phosphatidate cytidylyltransferase [Gemmatimonadaceae bacterium]